MPTSKTLSNCLRGNSVRRRPRRFNLVEVTLALAITGFGIAGIMSLFPVGLNATKKAVGDTYAADAADQFQAYIRAMASKPTTTAAPNWGTIAGLADSKPGGSSSDESGWEAAWQNIHTTAAAGVYGVKLSSGASGTITDFLADVKVWREDLVFTFFDGSNFNEHADTALDMGTGLCVEISWPVGKPYDQRDKRLFYIDVFKPL